MITARWILIAGLAFVFLYFGINKFTDPLLWIGWIPKWMDGLLGMDINLWLKILGALEILLGVGLLIPVRNIQKIVTVIIALHLIGVLSQVGWNDIGVRDLGLLSMTAALWFLL